MKVWQRACDPVGYSISKLSRLTGIESLEVKRIVAKLEKEGLIEKKWRRGFTGWGAKGTQDRVAKIDVDDK